MEKDPVVICLQKAWSALLNGDIKTRDQECERAKKILDAQAVIPSIKFIDHGDGITDIEFLKNS